MPSRVRRRTEKRQSKEEAANAARLLQGTASAFAFSTQGQAGDKPWEKFRENLRKAIAAGLPADAALRALTIDAARILGVDKQLGTVAKGKAAHLVVIDGDFQDAATRRSATSSPTACASSTTATEKARRAEEAGEKADAETG